MMNYRCVVMIAGIVAVIIQLVYLPAYANVSVNNVFTSHMVLQRNMVVPIWGTAASGEQVTVTLNGQTKTAIAATSGKWMVRLDPMIEGGPYSMTIKGNNTLTVSDVYMGEVWQCAGQSNMDTRMSYYANLADTIAKATIPLMRYYTLRQSSAPVQNNVWEVITPSTAGQLSATGFFFGREIQKTTGVAVGLVVTAVGGTFVEQWLDPVTLAANPAIVDTFKGQMWNAWVSQVVGYGIRGTVWIQGEQNCNTTGAPPYGARFKLLINGWRAAWGQGNFPFYFGQLSNIHTLQTDPNNTSTVATVREGQRLALSLPATAMSVHIDIGSANNWHFPNKPEAGRRLSLLAKANTYGQNTLVYSGPLYQSATINGNKVKLLFDTHGSNLVAMGGGALTGFAIANATGSWVFGTATISGDTVIVTSASVATPTRVRYAWADNPVFNLYNTAGLPASPFTTESPNIPVGIVAEHGKVHVQAATMATSGSVAPYPVDPLGRQSPLAGNRAKQILFTKNKNTGIVLLRTQTVKQMVPGCR